MLKTVFWCESLGNILVTGSSGQIGTDLTEALAKKFGKEKIIGADRKEPKNRNDLGKFEKTDVTRKENLEKLVKENNVETIYDLASLLSATGEKKPDLAWFVNISALKNSLDLARENSIKVFWPSSIAVFGPSTPKQNTPQQTILEPNTMYGITKVSGELLCNYYFKKYNVDVRSIRYPGLISYKTEAGGGTTDYAVEIFYEALKNKKYECFLKEDSTLPMMYMPDAINGTIKLMETDEKNIKTRLGYNISSLSFSPEEIANEIKKHIPEFECSYKPDERQRIADSWPQSIDDSKAREDWNWKPEYDLEKMTVDMLEKLKIKLGVK